MTKEVLKLDNPKFRCVSLVEDRPKPPRLDLTVESQGNTYKFALVKPIVITPQRTSIADSIKRLMQQEWTLAMVLRNDNQGKITYLFECAGDIAESPMLSIRACEYQANDGPEGLKIPLGKE